MQTNNEQVKVANERLDGVTVELSQNEKNLIVMAVARQTGAALSNILSLRENRLPVSVNEQNRANELRTIWDKLCDVGWDYPSDYSSENYQ